MYRKKHRASYEYHIPHDMVESILSRLPVKSLFRFKGVCKQWSATISGPKFAETHLRRSNTSSCSFVTGALRKIGLENDEFRELSPIENPRPSGQMLCGYCDGLFLIRCSDNYSALFLWNPSSRTYRDVCCQYQNVVHHLKYSGICYDPLVKDYKVMIGDANKYAVYYCKTNSWSKLKSKSTKEMNNDISPCLTARGVHFKGSIYWISNISRSSMKDDDLYRYELVCFDGRDEEMKNFDNILVCTTCCAKLISSRDCLYFIPIYGVDDDLPSNGTVTILMKKDGDDPWTEFKLKLQQSSSYHVVPLCSTQENKLVLYADHEQTGHQYLLYDNTNGGATQIQNTDSLRFFHLFPYLENLLSL